jgi:hypothetical protein
MKARRLRDAGQRRRGMRLAPISRADRTGPCERSAIIAAAKIGYATRLARGASNPRPILLGSINLESSSVKHEHCRVSP